MTVIRRELPDSNWREFETGYYRIVDPRILRWRTRSIRSRAQRRPDKPREFARDGGDRDLVRASSSGQAPIGALEPILRRPRLPDDDRGTVPLARRQRATNVRRMPIVP